MRKGAAGSGPLILSSASSVTSTFADVTYLKSSRLPAEGFCFSVVVGVNLPQIVEKCKRELVFPQYLHNGNKNHTKFSPFTCAAD